MGCEVIGIDSSPELVRAALELGLEVAVEDATKMSFDEEFDAVFSNAVLHWISDADRVIGNVFRASVNESRISSRLHRNRPTPDYAAG
jgi:trans-aconitate methyltransferase